MLAVLERCPYNKKNRREARRIRLLLAEDEEDLAEALGIFFEKNHFSVDVVHDGRAACEYAESSAYDAIILDVMMPRMDGFTVLRQLRARGDRMPIMMLTARGETRDRIEGFGAGADDYLPKPFDPDELLARLRAMLRRSDAYRPSVLSFGNLTLAPGSGELSCGGEKIRLGGREYQLMELFLRSPGMLFSAERLMEKIWGWDSDAEINVVWGNISNLRKSSSRSVRLCTSAPAGDLGICWRPENDEKAAREVYPYRHAVGCTGASGTEPDCQCGELHFHKPGSQPEAQYDL